MTPTAARPAAAALPAPTVATLVTLIYAGAVATVAFDFFGQALSPGLGFASLAPVPLATQVWEVLFGVRSGAAGNALHYLAGMVAYPLGWWLIARPLAARIVPGLHWLLPATVYGIGLWVFAMYFMATLIAGQPAFLGFTGITWVALVGHVLFALVAAWVIEARDPR